MKKGYFLVFDDINVNTGVNRKIRSQIETFIKNGIEISPKRILFKTDFPGYKWLYRLPFTNLSPVWKIDESYSHVDFVYLRRPFFTNYWFVRFLKKLKDINPPVKIIYEIPTFPYDSEIKKKKSNYPVFIKDVISRRRLYKYIDRIAILSDEKKVFGIKTLQISNGYDFDKQPIRLIREPDNKINIIAVALFDMWHGYERLLKGIEKYYLRGGDRNITLHFAGDGPELQAYKKLANKLGVSSHCKFYGMLNQKELNEIYNSCDIAASSFGLHKIGVYTSKELKSREYLAKGLPLLCSGHIDLLDIEELEPYLLCFPGDDSLVNFDDVISFYDKLYLNKTREETAFMSSKIRSIAEKYLNMDEAMRNVIDYLLH